MVFNLADFKANINKTGIARSSNFRAMINPSRNQTKIARTISAERPADMRQLAMRVQNTELPGRTIATTENRIYGPTRKMAYDTNYDILSMTILCSEDLREKIYFEEWQERMIDPGSGKDSRFNVGYYDDYVANVFIQQLSEDGRVVYEITLVDAIPTVINAMDVSWEDENLHRFTVSFQYHYWVRGALLDTRPSAAQNYLSTSSMFGLSKSIFNKLSPKDLALRELAFNKALGGINTANFSLPTSVTQSLSNFAPTVGIVNQKLGEFSRTLGSVTGLSTSLLGQVLPQGVQQGLRTATSVLGIASSGVNFLNQPTNPIGGFTGLTNGITSLTGMTGITSIPTSVISSFSNFAPTNRSRTDVIAGLSTKDKALRELAFKQALGE